MEFYLSCPFLEDGKWKDAAVEIVKKQVYPVCFARISTKIVQFKFHFQKETRRSTSERRSGSKEKD